MKNGRCVVDYAYYNGVQQDPVNYSSYYYNRKAKTGRYYQSEDNSVDYDGSNSGSDNSIGSGSYGNGKDGDGKPCAVRVETFASYKVCMKGKKVGSIECGQDLCTRGRCKCPW